MRSTGAIITDIIEVYGNRFGQWVRITEIADKAGLTKAELIRAITELLDDGDFWAEPEQIVWTITDRDKEVAPVIGGEPRHLICWGYC